MHPSDLVAHWIFSDFVSKMKISRKQKAMATFISILRFLLNLEKIKVFQDFSPCIQDLRAITETSLWTLKPQSKGVFDRLEAFFFFFFWFIFTQKQCLFFWCNPSSHYDLTPPLSAVVQRRNTPIDPLWKDTHILHIWIKM